MRNLTGALIVAALTACGGGGSGQTVPQIGTAACENDGQKQFVLDNLYAWYLWNDLLPTGIDIADYATPEELVSVVTREFGPQDADGNPVDLFSSVGSAQADSEFLGEGKLGEIFGFSYRLVDQAATDFRIVRVFSGSPAATGNPPLARGQRILTLNGRSVAEITGSEGISTFFSNNDTVEFEIERVGANDFTTITKAAVTIDPIPQWRLIDRGEGVAPVGYMQFDTFVSTADAIFNTVFADFKAAGVNDLIIDLRYNGGGRLSTTNLLGDYLGGSVAQNLVFSRTEYNADRAAANNSTEFFDLLGNSISLSRLIIVATRSTASASELVTNGMIPHVDVAIVGDRTLGKPVGQIGLEFCDKILRPTSFRFANADGVGDFFEGLPVDCAAPDDLSTGIGADDDPNVVAALSYLNTGACPVAAVSAEKLKSEGELRVEELDRRGPPEREFLDAY
ncbi:MAG: S41 family peptidase [Woeseiaceae bacterium]